MEQEKILTKLINDRQTRIKTVYQSLFWFILTYLNHYITYPTAQFQKEMMAIAENPNLKMAIVVAFRGSAKSTIFTLAYALWAVLGIQQKKFIVILSQTQNQARQHLLNIKRELESNDLLRLDLGPFKEESDYWGSLALYIPKYNAKIIAASSEQSIRGLRHGSKRPDLIIGDDIEDLVSVKTKEGRDKAFEWFSGDVLPSGDLNTKTVVIGNLLHEDSLLMRLRQAISEGNLRGIFRSFPLVDENGKILWPGKFPDNKSTEDFKLSIGSESAWQREFLLRIMPEDEQVVFKDWIKYYDQLPDKQNTEYRFTWFGVDPAISLKTTADYTGIVGAQVHGYGKNIKIYILPNPINKRLNFPELVDNIKLLLNVHKGENAKALVENVAYQASVFQQLQREGYSVDGVKILGDKRERTVSITHLIQSGKIVFPRQGAEDLTRQLVGFGVEKHEDLVDAFTLLIHKIIENNHGKPDILWLDWGPPASERGWRPLTSLSDLSRW